MRQRLRVVAASVLSGLPLVVGGLMPALVSADSNTINFEPSTYHTGPINGQDGWTALGSAGSGTPYDEAVASSNGTKGFASQSFRISNAVTSGGFGDQAFAKPLMNAVGESGSSANSYSKGTLQNHFETSFSIASSVPGAQQPGLAISVSPDRGDGSRMSYLRFEDGTAGLNVFFDDVQGTTTPVNFNETQVASNLDRTKPHTVKLTLDALEGPSNDVVNVSIDGNLVHTGTSWENYYRYDAEASAEQSPRIVKTVGFFARGTAASATTGKGFLIDNLSLSSSTTTPTLPYPTSKDQCKNNGWKQFTNPSFKNQGQCIQWVEATAEGNLKLAGPSQKISFNVANMTSNSKDEGNNNSDRSDDHDNHSGNTVEYWNYNYPGGLHYKTNVLGAYVNPQTNETRFMFQIPAGYPGLSGLYVVAYAKDVNGKHTADLYGHAATGDLAMATQWYQTGVGYSPTMYTVTRGEVKVE